MDAGFFLLRENLRGPGLPRGGNGGRRLSVESGIERHWTPSDDFMPFPARN
jgi:hypothetical protein